MWMLFESDERGYESFFRYQSYECMDREIQVRAEETNPTDRAS